MTARRWFDLVIFLSIGLTPAVHAQESSSWHDPSPHKVHFVTVDENVKLEVLDWGGSGRPVVLLTGLGNTAHVFDDFAPKLTPEYHLYGITRRGYGESSAPAPDAANYSADRLGDDVLAVLDALKIDRPVLVGHSIGGEELSSVATRHPDRVAGLVYLDGGYSYAFYDRLLGNEIIDLRELREKLNQLHPENGVSKADAGAIATMLPQIERELQVDLQSPPGMRRPAPSASDLASFPALRSFVKRTRGIDMPEAEIRQAFQARPDGGVGGLRVQSNVGPLIQTGEQKYTDIRVSVLAIFADPQDDGPYMKNDPAARAAFQSSNMIFSEGQAKAFERGVPSAHVVRLPDANHDIFMSNEADVLREIHDFLKKLPKS